MVGLPSFIFSICHVHTRTQIFSFHTHIFLNLKHSRLSAWICRSMIEHTCSTHEPLGLISSTHKKKCKVLFTGTWACRTVVVLCVTFWKHRLGPVLALPPTAMVQVTHLLEIWVPHVQNGIIVIPLL
jgi:hypothetical protein